MGKFSNSFSNWKNKNIYAIDPKSQYLLFYRQDKFIFQTQSNFMPADAVISNE